MSLDKCQTRMLISPFQVAYAPTRRPALSSHPANLGRPTAGCRPQADSGAPPGCDASGSAAAPSRLPRARHSSRHARRLLPPIRPCLPRRHACAGRGLPQGVPDHSLFDPERSHPSHHRGGRRRTPVFWDARARDQARTGDQPRSRSPRRRLGRSLPRPRAHHTAGSPACTRLCSDEFQEARDRCGRNRSLLVGGMVRRLGERARGALATRAFTRGAPAVLARRGGMAPARAR